jgi:hypothetical protein
LQLPALRLKLVTTSENFSADYQVGEDPRPRQFHAHRADLIHDVTLTVIDVYAALSGRPDG